MDIRVAKVRNKLLIDKIYPKNYFWQCEIVRGVLEVFGEIRNY